MKNKHNYLLALSLSIITALYVSTGSLRASELSKSAVARMPVKEVTIFKDGHAVINQEGEMPTNSSADVILDSLPSPLLGTFFPYSTDNAVKLVSVTAGQRKIKMDRTALALPELIAANIGAGFHRDIAGVNHDVAAKILARADGDIIIKSGTLGRTCFHDRRLYRHGQRRHRQQS